jgi:pimeloyl-ACP methyl ester carboxylesterase
MEEMMAESLPVVLVPGLNCSPRLYAAQMPALWSFGPVTVADHTREETMEAIAARILGDAPPRFALVGLSMGGYVAMAMMRAAPDRVAKLALLDTGPRADTPQQSDNRKRQIEIALAGRFADIPGLQWPLLVHKNRQHDAALREVVVRMAEETGAEAFARQQRAIMGRPDSRPSLSQIGCPALILVGEGDQLTPPELAQEMNALIRGSRLVVVPDCGHLSTLERPEAVTRALVEFMQSRI